MDTTPPDNYIAWTAAPATNALRFEHVGCVVGGGTWTHPLDGIHLPLTEDRTHCECCGLEKRLRRGNGSAEAFRVDRGRLRAHLIAEGETDPDDDDARAAASATPARKRSPASSCTRWTPARSAASATSRSTSTSATTTP